MGHLVYDAPEVLIGMACAIFSGSQIIKKITNNNSKKLTVSSGLISSIISGYVGYLATKKFKNYLE